MPSLAIRAPRHLPYPPTPSLTLTLTSLTHKSQVTRAYRQIKMTGFTGGELHYTPE